MTRRFVFAAVLVVLMGAGSPLSAQTGLPPTLNGLTVTAEHVSHPGARTARDYLDNVRLYSLRSGKQLEATLQIGHLRSSAPTTFTFHRSIAQQVGTTVPVENRLASETVFVTRGKRLSVAVWFSGRNLFILSIREGYLEPKTLIRETIGVQP